MSKKNNQTIKEKEEAAKRAAKLEKKQARLKEAAAMGVAAPKRLKHKAKKGVRIRKHVVVRGVKITDADSKRKVKQMLAAEEAMKSLMMDTDEAPQGEQGEQGEQQGAKEAQMREKKVGYGKARGGSGTKVKVKAGGKAKKGKAEGMALD